MFTKQHFSRGCRSLCDATDKSLSIHFKSHFKADHPQQLEKNNVTSVQLSNMALKGMSLICLLFIAMSVISISRAQNPLAFRRKHLTLLDTIDHNRCNSEMRNKRIAMTRDGCKKLNTFIHAREEVIDATCTMGKVHVIKGQEYKKSIHKFRVTNCRLSGEYPNDCEYMAEKSAWKYIVISCDQNDRPVHFAGTLNW
ncbi:unnamed protein product [Caretta caretta]